MSDKSDRYHGIIRRIDDPFERSTVCIDAASLTEAADIVESDMPLGYEISWLRRVPPFPLVFSS